MPRIDLTRADTEPLAFHQRLDLPAEHGGEDVVSAGPVEIEGVVEKAEKGFVLNGRVRGSATLRCGRCLTEFPLQFDEDLEISLLPASQAPREDEIRLSKGDLDVIFFEEPMLDLGALAAEQFQLAIPIKPVCRESCKGLCPRCGADLNQGPCICPPDTDDRWAPLLDWRPKS